MSAVSESCLGICAVLDAECHSTFFTVGDYVSGFLGLAENNFWNMNPFEVCYTAKKVK